MVINGDNVPLFDKMSGDKMREPNGTSNVFQILCDIWKQQLTVQSQYNSRVGISFQDHHTLKTSTDEGNSKVGKSSTCKCTFHTKYFTEWTSSTLCTCPQAVASVLKPKDSLAMRKVQHLRNGRTSVNRLPLTKQDILSHYSGCFEGIGHFPGEPYKFHLKPEHKPARHALRKVPIHLEDAFKEEIKSLVELGILEEVKEHTDWVNSYVIVEKDSGSHHAPNHTIKSKLRICLDPRDLNEALEREPYYTHSVYEITAKHQGMTVFTIVNFKKGYWMVVLHPDSRKLTCMALPFGRF